MKFIPYTLACLAITSIPFPVQSQIKPDPRATEPSIIENGTISGGLSSGENLFHSFEQFNIKVNETVRFENPDRIHNIFSQITGNDPSTIAGTIQVNGPANLILLNPNGIIFTPTAKLDLQGAFTATTASDVILEDDSRWNASNPNRPTLTISTPIGLGFYNQNGQGIIVKDVGQQSGVINEGPERIQISNPIIETNTEQGLINSSINLIGNQVILNNGIVATPSGQLTIGSILEGTTTIGTEEIIFSGQRGDIILTDNSLISGTGSPNGSILIWGKNLNLTNNSVIINSNLGEQDGGNISLNLEHQLTAIGITEPKSLGLEPIIPLPGIVTQAFSQGNSGDINIEAHSISISKFATITSTTFGKGNTSNINIATEQLTIDGKGILPTEPIFASSITTVVQGLGNGGDINIESNNISVKSGGIILSQSRNLGNSGDIKIDNREAIIVQGNNGLFESTIGNTSAISGENGAVEINTETLILDNGGQINSTSNGNARGGSITVNADQIQLNTNPNSTVKSEIVASNETASDLIRLIFNISGTPTGEGGKITINSQKLNINNSIITINNEGIGDAGNLSLKTDFIILDEGEISSVAEFRGDGGNLNIDANTIVGKNESQILANSQNGQGGQITIDTKYLFGFMFRDTTGDEIGLSEITAISLNDPELNGNVSISENNFFDRIETTEINLRPIEQINPPQCLTQSNGESRFRRRSTNGTPLLLPKWESNQIGNTIIQQDDRTYLVNSQNFQNCN